MALTRILTMSILFNPKEEDGEKETENENQPGKDGIKNTKLVRRSLVPDTPEKEVRKLV